MYNKYIYDFEKPLDEIQFIINELKTTSIKTGADITLKLNGELISIRDLDKNDDQCVEEGFVSITPLRFDLTDQKTYLYLKEIENEFNHH